jgi:hypothetical protein
LIFGLVFADSEYCLGVSFMTECADGDGQQLMLIRDVLASLRANILSGRQADWDVKHTSISPQKSTLHIVHFIGTAFESALLKEAPQELSRLHHQLCTLGSHRRVSLVVSSKMHFFM